MLRYAILLLPLILGCAAPVPPSEVADVRGDTLHVEAFGPTFRDGRAVGIDPSGRMYVADAGDDRVHILASNGSAISVVGGSGSGEYAFLTPSGVDPTNGLTLIVADAGNSRIQRFSRDGRLTASIPVPVNPEGVILGRPAEAEGIPRDVVEAQTGELYTIEELRGVVIRWDEHRSVQRVIGGPEDGEGRLQSPVALAIDPEGRLLVADNRLRSVQIYDTYGSYLGRIAGGTAVGVRSVAVSDTHIAVILENAILWYDLNGLFLSRNELDVPHPLVDAAFYQDQLVVLTARRLYRVSLN